MWQLYKNQHEEIQQAQASTVGTVARDCYTQQPIYTDMWN